MNITVHYTNGVVEDYFNSVDFGFNTNNERFIYIITSSDPERSVVINGDGIKKVELSV